MKADTEVTNEQLLLEVKDLFDKAEHKIKLVERSKEEKLCVPSINELRYAGHHILEAETSDDGQRKEEQLKKAASHCRRAIYDAIEIRVLYSFRKISSFKDDYENTVISEVIDSYIEKLKRINAIQSSLNQMNRNHDNRETYYEEIEDYSNELEEISNEFEIAREELNKKKRREGRNILTAVFGLSLTFIGIIVTILIAAFAS